MSLLRRLGTLLTAALASLAAACGPETTDQPPADAILVGALLPFTGKEAAIGRNLEQAMLLAIRDVNEAGGVNGRPLALISRDSNSGSARGFDELLQLLYVDKVAYLVGPEENELANSIIPDVKALDVLNILPGYAAPVIKRSSSRGAWLRLAPTPAAIGCGMAKSAIAEGILSANSIVTLDDYNMNVAAEFQALFAHLGGSTLPSVTVQAGAGSYIRQIKTALDYGAERTLLIAYPATASTIATEWTITDRRGSWYLSPMLHTELFLLNTPFGAMRGYTGISPSLALLHECQPSGTSNADRMICTRDNANAFAAHFAAYWGGDRPFPPSHFYYDSIVLLAMGLSRALAASPELPSAARLRDYIRDLGDENDEHASWQDLREPMAKLSAGDPINYVGAAAEYDFDSYGMAEHVVFDTWRIGQESFVDMGPRMAVCPRPSQ